MKSLKNLIHEILTTGEWDGNRTGKGTIEIEGAMIRHNVRTQGFPLCTSKKVNLEWVFRELKMFLNGWVDTDYLKQHGVTIWDTWAIKEEDIEGLPLHTKMTLATWLVDNDFCSDLDGAMDYLTDELGDNWAANIRKWCEDKYVPWWNNPVAVKVGDLGPVYGKNWIGWNTSKGESIDQIKIAINRLMQESKGEVSKSRRNIVMTWNPEDLPDETKSPEQNVLDGKQALAPCHFGFQFNTLPLVGAEQEAWSEQSRKVSLHWYQRSCDVPVGLPYNIASYSLLLTMVAATCNLVVNNVIFHGANVHIYENQMDGIKKYIANPEHKLPHVRVINRRDNIADYEWEDFEIIGYEHEGFVSMGELAK